MNLTLVQSSVLVTLDPLVSGQFNQAFVDVTGTISDPSEDVCIQVNGTNAYYLDDAGDWEADHVPVNPTGTATFDVELYTNDPVNIGSQVFQPPQPAVVSLMSYTKHYHRDETWYHYCMDGPVHIVADDEVNWLYASGGEELATGSGKEGGCDPYNDNDAYSLADGFNGYGPTWQSAASSDNFDIDNSVAWGLGGADVGNDNNTVQTKVMIVPSGQQAIGQSALYLVMAQVMDEDTGEQLLAGAVQFMHQLAGTATEDVTNYDGSVWTEAVVSGPAGAQIEATPIAAGDIGFTGMKLSKMVYFSVAPPPGSITDYFDAHAIQTNLESQLAGNVFDSLPAGEGVRIMVRVESSYGGILGWNSSKQTYVNRVNWDFTGMNVAQNDRGIGNIGINYANVFTECGTANPDAQTFVNIFAHEGIWGNACGKSDDSTVPYGDIAHGGANAFSPYTVAPSSRSTIRSKFGF